jgi:hypothetical protein
MVAYIAGPDFDPVGHIATTTPIHRPDRLTPGRQLIDEGASQCAGPEYNVHLIPLAQCLIEPMPQAAATTKSGFPVLLDR